MFQWRRYEPNQSKASSKVPSAMRSDVKLTRGSRIRERRTEIERKNDTIDDGNSFVDDFGGPHDEEVKNWRYHLTNQHF